MGSVALVAVALAVRERGDLGSKLFLGGGRINVMKFRNCFYSRCLIQCGLV